MNKKYLILAWLISVVTLLAYSNTFKADFAFDDFHQIVENPNVMKLSNIPRYFVDAGIASTDAAIRGYRPITYSSFVLNYALGEYNVAWWHLVNLLIHLANVLLVGLVTARVIERARPKPVVKPGQKTVVQPATAKIAAPFITAALFALHPIQTNAVTYISGRAGMLGAFFCLSAFAVFIEIRENRDAGRRLPLFAVFSALFILALLSKETSVALVGILIADDFIFTVPEGGGLKGLRRAVPAYIPVAVIIAAFIVLRQVLLGFVTATGGGPPISVQVYFMSELKVFWLYVRLMFLPVHQCVDYCYPAVTAPDAWVLSSAIGIVLLVAGIVFIRKKSPAAAFFGLWFIAALMPESSFIPIRDIAVEYRMYLPSVGFIAAFAILMEDLFTTHRKELLAAASVAAIALSLVTFNRNQVWATSETLWTDVLNNDQDSPRALNNLGVFYAGRNDIDKSIEIYRKAIKLYPDYADAYANLGLSYLNKGMIQEAIEQLRHAVKIDPSHARALYNLGFAHMRQGEVDLAMEEFKKSLKSRPSDPVTHNALGIAYSKKGMVDLALGEFNEALRLDEKSSEAHKNLGLLYSGRGSMDRAVEEYRAGIVNAPDDYELHYNLGIALKSLGKNEEGLSELEDAASLRPDALDVINNLAIAYAEAGMFDKSAEKFRVAVRLQPGNKALMENLAAVEKMAGGGNKAATGR